MSKTKWREVAHILRPEMTDEQFDAAWSEFVELKRKRERH